MCVYVCQAHSLPSEKQERRRQLSPFSLSRVIVVGFLCSLPTLERSRTARETHPPPAHINARQNVNVVCRLSLCHAVKTSDDDNSRAYTPRFRTEGRSTWSHHRDLRTSAAVASHIAIRANHAGRRSVGLGVTTFFGLSVRPSSCIHGTLLHLHYYPLRDEARWARCFHSPKEQGDLPCVKGLSVITKESTHDDQNSESRHTLNQCRGRENRHKLSTPSWNLSKCIFHRTTKNNHQARPIQSRARPRPGGMSQRSRKGRRTHRGLRNSKLTALAVSGGLPAVKTIFRKRKTGDLVAISGLCTNT